ncbi:hypothetical protein OAE48_05285 [Flavobacteriales bacterium]|nr:hypothetical protein [Flavobacteriales bacterium]
MKAFLLIFSLLATSTLLPGQQIDILPRGKEGIYKAEFNIRGTKINGFLAVKHKKNNALHVSFTSPMGNNLLEMQWKKGRWKKIYAIKKLGSRHVYGMMAEDILLLFAHYQYDRSFEDFGNEWKWDKKTLQPVWKDDQLESVKIITKRHRPSRTVRYVNGDDCIDELSINHQGYPFSIVLKPVKKK